MAKKARKVLVLGRLTAGEFVDSSDPTRSRVNIRRPLPVVDRRDHEFPESVLLDEKELQPVASLLRSACDWIIEHKLSNDQSIVGSGGNLLKRLTVGEFSVAIFYYPASAKYSVNIRRHLNKEELAATPGPERETMLLWEEEVLSMAKLADAMHGWIQQQRTSH